MNDTDRDGNTALILAAEHGWADVVEYLIHKGANKSLINNQGENAATAAQNEESILWYGPFTNVLDLIKKGR